MKYLFFISAVFLLASCRKEEVTTFHGSEGIAFYTDKYEADSLIYSFAFAVTEKPKDTVWLKMRVTGTVSDKPRRISVRAGEGTTARSGKDYMLPEAFLPAGALTVKYPVVLLNSPEMKTTIFRLVVQVAESDDLVVGATGQEMGETTSLDHFVFHVSNQLVEPAYWPDISSRFGMFSATKFRFMMQVTGLTDFSVDAIGIDGLYNLPVKLKNALDEYVAMHGPLMDENGNEVTF